MTPPQDRVILAVPFAENDEAKQHGACWDAIRKEWWIARRDIGANLGIWRWLPGGPLKRTAKAACDWLATDQHPTPTRKAAQKGRKAVQNGKHKGKKTSAAQRKARTDPTAPITTERRDFSLPERDCSCPPWADDCDHAPATGDPPHPKMIDDISRWW